MRSRIRNISASLLVLTTFASQPTWAASAAKRATVETGLRAFDGHSVRQVRNVTHEAPQDAALTHWLAFKAQQPGAEWKAVWDSDTRVPLRIYGSGMPAPGVSSNPMVAEQVARQMLGQYITLLAPGSQPSDFQLVSNVELKGVRSVGFHQTSAGMPVVSGQVSFRFKNNRLVAMASEALPDVITTGSRPTFAKQAMESAALDWLRRDVGNGARQVGGASELMILPVIGGSGSKTPIQYHTVRSIPVESSQPAGLWDVYVDAASGQPVARQQRLMFGSGSAIYNTPERWPGGSRVDLPATDVTLTVDANPTNTNQNGEFIWTGTADASVTSAVVGPYARVINSAGAVATANFAVPNAGSFTWNDSATELVDAQITAFVHTNLVKDYVRPWNPGLAWLDQQIAITVNINDTCNAFSDGDSINFFRQGGGCSNTARLTDVVYHEFGHSLHSQSIIAGVGAFESSMSEGAGDFLSATITGDSGLGRGFFQDNSPLREINPVGTEAVYPDDLDPDTHVSGLIYAGAFWDLREALIASLGSSAGIQKTEQLFYATLQRATDMPSSYVEALIEDDDDGNLGNGTPNYCDINNAFRIHGLTEGGPNAFAGPPAISALTVSLQVESALPDCGQSISAISVDWRNRDNFAENGSLPMLPNGSTYTAVLPFPGQNAVVQYQVTVTYSDARTLSFPQNIGDQWYEQYVGTTTDIYCTDFETDPEMEGWTHALLAGTDQPGADDWQWGVPMGNSNSRDPTAAYSGTRVFGNDLGDAGFNGIYRSDITNRATSPVIDVSGYDTVRLQYRRWLNVEDGIYDKATIYANDVAVWSNFASGNGGSGIVHHQDREWRFHDVDLTPQVQNNSVQVAFEIASDAGLEMGGWNLDNVCIVGIATVPPTPDVFKSGFEQVVLRP